MEEEPNDIPIDNSSWIDRLPYYASLVLTIIFTVIRIPGIVTCPLLVFYPMFVDPEKLSVKWLVIYIILGILIFYEQLSTMFTYNLLAASHKTSLGMVRIYAKGAKAQVFVRCLLHLLLIVFGYSNVSLAANAMTVILMDLVVVHCATPKILKKTTSAGASRKGSGCTGRAHGERRRSDRGENGGTALSRSGTIHRGRIQDLASENARKCDESQSDVVGGSQPKRPSPTIR